MDKLIGLPNFTLSEIESSSSYVNNPSYTKISDTITPELESLFQSLFDLQNAKVLGKAYIAEFPKGINGVMVQHNDGVLGVLKDPKTGKFNGQITWHELSGLAGATALFSVLSIATAQFYLHEINQKLDDIQKRVDSILEFLYTDKFCEISANLKAMLNMHQNYALIMKSKEYRSACISNVLSAKTIAEKNIQFFYRDMTNLVDKVDPAKLTTDRKTAFQLRDDMESYEQAVNLFGIATVLEVALTQTFEKEYLERIQSDLDAREERHKLFFAKLDGKLEAAGKVKAPAPIIPGLPELPFMPAAPKKPIPEMSELSKAMHKASEDNVPIAKYKSVINEIASAYSSPSNFIVTEQGAVYKNI